MIVYHCSGRFEDMDTWNRYTESLKKLSSLGTDSFALQFSSPEEFPYILSGNDPYILLEHLVRYILCTQKIESDTPAYAQYLPSYVHSRNGYWVRNYNDSQVQKNIVIKTVGETHGLFLQFQESTTKSKKTKIFFIKNVLLCDSRLTIANMSLDEYACNFYAIFIMRSPPETHNQPKTKTDESAHNQEDKYKFVSFEDEYLEQVSHDFNYTSTRVYNSARIDIRSNRLEYFSSITDKIVVNSTLDNSQVFEILRSKEGIKKIRDFRSQCKKQLEKMCNLIITLKDEVDALYGKSESFIDLVMKLKSLNPRGKTLNEKSIKTKFETINQFLWFYIRLYVSVQNEDTRKKLRVPDIVPILCSPNAIKIIELYLSYCEATLQVRNKTVMIRREHFMFVCEALRYFITVPETRDSLQTLCENIARLKISKVIQDKRNRKPPAHLIGESPEYDKMSAFLKEFHKKIIDNYRRYIDAVKDRKTQGSRDLWDFVTVSIIGVCSRIATRQSMLKNMILGKNVKTVSSFLSSQTPAIRAHAQNLSVRLKEDVPCIDHHLCINGIEADKTNENHEENVKHKTGSKDTFIFCPTMMTVFLYDVWAIILCADSPDPKYKTFLDFRQKHFSDIRLCMQFVTQDDTFKDASPKRFCLVEEKKINTVIRRSFEMYYRDQNPGFSEKLKYHIKGIRNEVCFRIQILKSQGVINDKDIDDLCPGILAHSRDIHDEYYANGQFAISPETRNLMDNLWSLPVVLAKKNLAPELQLDVPGTPTQPETPLPETASKSTTKRKKRVVLDNTPDNSQDTANRVSASGRVIKKKQRFVP